MTPRTLFFSLFALITLVFGRLASQEAARKEGAKDKPAPLPALDVKTIEDTLGVDWYGVYMKDRKIGYVRAAREKVDDTFVDLFHMHMKLTRKVDEIEEKTELIISTTQVFEGKPPFRLLRGEHKQVSGPVTVQTILERAAPKFKVTRKVGKQETVQNIEPLEHDLAAALEAELWLRSKPQAGDTLTTRDLSLDELRIDTQKNKILAVKKGLISGVDTVFYEVESIPERLKLKVLFRYDARGRLLNGNFTLFELRRESEKDAKNTEFSQDIFVLGTVQVDKGLGGNDDRRELVLEVVGKEGDVFENGPHQKVEMSRNVRLLKLGKSHGVATKATPKEIEESLQETAAYPISHPRIKEMAAKATQGATTPEEKVKKLVDHVYTFVRPDLSPNQPHILDLLERRKGDCKAYALLFNTLARASGIPARELGGLVYMGDGIKAFGGHAWNEVVLDGVWRPIDASRRQVEADATHLSLGHDTKDANLLKLMGGKLSFKVIEAR